jgi:hypothetical protein
MKKILIIIIIAALVIAVTVWQYKSKYKEVTHQTSYYSVSLPADLKQEINDVGAGLDYRLAGHTYSASSAPLSFDVFVYNNNGLDVKDYLKKKTNSNFYPPTPNLLPDGTISIDYQVIPSTSGHGEGLKEIIYSVSGKISGYTYYFGDSNYIYLINVDYDIPNADRMSVLKYNNLWQASQPTIGRVIDSFTVSLPASLPRFPRYCDWPPCISNWADMIYFILSTRVAVFIYLFSLIAAVILTITALARKKSRKKFLIWAAILVAIGLIPPEIIRPLLSLFTSRYFTPVPAQ